ncbi:MAG: xanthine dehydrogenase family protein molybdopterin-binding subunit [Candidatus Dormibacteraeota bacterium]|nr:xanthine dehydrogenase family protein molybdopterin-binding subunit [Candidatus Dormibacteraeota bacterium]
MKVLGSATYLADLNLPGALEAAFVRSPVADATFAAQPLPEGVYDAAALGVESIEFAGPGLVASRWPPLAEGRVRYVGEAAAVAVAADRYHAEDLAESVFFDYRPVEREPLHLGAPDGVLFRADFTGGDPDAEFARAALVVERTFRTARQTPLPLENRGVAAAPAGGRLTVWTSTQVPHLARTLIARCLRLPEESVRVVTPEVGGGFGLKAHVFPEEIVVAGLALKLGRPVRWVEDRRENLLASAHAHEEEVGIRLALDRDGHFLAATATVVADVGAYSIYPFSAALEPVTTAQTLFGPYALRAFSFAARGVASSKCPAGAYRGVGMNAAAYATERMVDVVAAELGIDPLELRRRNVVTEFPTLTAAGRNLDSGDYRGLLDRLEAGAGYADLRRRQASARAEGRLVGVGIGIFNEHSGTGSTEYLARGVTAIPGNDSARVRVTETGRIEIFTSAAEAGQGHPETYRMLAARELGVEPALVDVVEGDTDSCPPGSGTFVSRGAVGGLTSLVEALREVAEKDLAPGLDVTRSVDPSQVYPSGAHLALVEVDATGCIPRVLAYHAVEDCGTVVNHDAVEGQVRGGIAMGLGGVLLEEFAYSADGQPLTSTLLDYLVPLATDVPADMTLEHIESSSPRTALGSKGVGEGGTIGAFAAIANAVADAVYPLGVTLTDLPYSPDAIFSAIAAAERSRG